MRDPRYQHHVVPYVCPGRFLLNGPGEACLHDQFSCGILQHLLISIQSVSSLQFLQSSSDTEKNRAGFSECAPFFPPYLACSDVTLCSSTDCLLEKHTVRTAVFCLLGKRSIRSRRSFFCVRKKCARSYALTSDCLSLSRQPQIDSDDSQCGPDLIAISASTAETVAESVCPVW